MEREPTDPELMLAYQRGESEAFDALYRRYSAKVYGYVLSRVGGERSRADDVFQAIFLKLHQSRWGYDPRLPFAPWLFTICRTVLVDSRRKQGGIAGVSVKSLADSDVEEAPASETHPLGSIGGSVEGWAELPEQQQRAIELRYREGFTFEQIGRELRTSSANARQLISRAVRKLRTLRGK